MTVRESRERGQASPVPVRLRMMALALSCAGMTMLGCGFNSLPPEDDAKAAGLTALDFPTVTVDVFRGMDRGLVLSPDEIQGRNDWIL